MMISQRLSIGFVVVCMAWPLAAQSPSKFPYTDVNLPVDRRVDDLVERMTLEEKVSQMVNSSAAVPRLNVPAYDWWNEGLHGVARSGYATMFPQAIGMAATWDSELLGRIGQTISTEARAKYNQAIRHDIHSRDFGLTIWSPNINIFRDPRWGRGQETYGEDPYLTSRLGVAFVEGLQGTNPKYYRTIATPKHFAVHSGPESTRHSANIDPTPHDLWDTYLPAFRATIVEAKADSIMCAYNSVDNTPACASKLLLQDTLRKDWQFGGFVTSDCGAVDDFFKAKAHLYTPDKESAAVAGVRAGTDTNCGSTYLALTSAVGRGLIKESEIDVSVKRLFKARFMLGMFDPETENPYASIPFSEIDSPAHQALALEAAYEAMVLLKNENHFLPLKPGLKSIAVIGPNAASLSALEGNYNAVPRNPIMPVDGLAAEFPLAKVIYAQGSSYVDGVAMPVPRTLLHPAKDSPEEGLKAEYFSSDNVNGQAVTTRTDKQIDFDWKSASPVPDVPPDHFAVRWSGTITAPAPGTYDFAVRLPHCYQCAEHEKYAVYVDGKPVASFATPSGEPPAGGTPRFSVPLNDTVPHDLRLEYTHNAKLYGGGISLEWVPKPGLLEPNAVAAARQAEVVVMFLGLSPELEGEEMPIHVEGFSGGDRTDIKLPAAQEHLLEAIAALGKPIVVVLMNGSALAVNWAQQHAEAVLEAWYPGEAGAQAIAETLSGKNNPGGRLPITFYSSIEQLPDFSDYSMSNRTYRYFKGAPLYGFGYGLSYTTFAYSDLHVSTARLKAGETLKVEADVRNTGTVAGDEVTELYLTPPHTTVSPNLALAGFKRVHIAPGETKHVKFELGPRTLSQVDDRGMRAVRAGTYLIRIGGSQPTGSSPSVKVTISGQLELPR